MEAAIDFYEISSRKSAHWWIDEAYFMIGASDFMEGRHLLAMRQFEEMEHRFPGSPYTDRLPYLSVLGELEARATHAEMDSALVANLSADYSADVMLRIGYLFLQDGDLAPAQGNFLRAAETARDDKLVGECFLFAGECAYMRRFYDDAARYYDMAVRKNPERSRHANWGLSWFHLRESEYQDARIYLSTVFSGYDDDFASHARITYAETFLAEGDYLRASEELEDFLESCSGEYCDNGLYDLILAYRRLGDTTRVIEYSRRFASRYRRSPLAEDVIPHLSQLLFDREDYREVLILADDVENFSLSRETADRLRFLAERARYHLGIYEDPLAVTTNFLEKYPDTPLVGEILMEMGGYLCSIGDYEKGAIAFDRLRERSIPDSLWIDASYRMGVCYLGMGDTSAAGEIFQQLLGEFPESPLAARGMISLGDHYRSAGNLSAAVGAYNRVLEYAGDPGGIAQAELRLAESYAELERYPESRILFTSLLEEGDASPETRRRALLGLLDAYYRMAEYERGFRMGREVLDTLEPGPYRCELSAALGKLALRIGNIDFAAGNLMPPDSGEVICSGAEDPSILHDLALALEVRGRDPEAREVWERLIAVSEDDSVVALARDKLSSFEREENRKTAP